MKKYTLVLNPVSGRGAGAQAAPTIEATFKQAGFDFTLLRTERPGHAIQLARQAAADGDQVVVAVGGDGTANEVLNGLMQVRQAQGRTSALGVVAVGRGNDFAFGMGTPIGLEAGCQAILADHRSAIDVGKVTGGDYPVGRYFGNGVGIGFDAVVGFVAARNTHLRGFISYLVAALQTIFLYYHAPLVHLDLDGQPMELSSLMISIMNGRRMGGGFMMAPTARSDDGLLDLCIAEQVSKGKILALIPHFMRGDQASQKSIHTCQARKVHVRALQGSLPVHADGETICTQGSELTIELLPAQLEMLCTPVEGSV
ncbi:MAG: diacylglycerol kinase family lipid kinase [Anaerolineales bacterium]|nr:diacylglycerol kinase family lipid kinase [Anaerolineales bacterium]